jgi:hypothetical protein
VGYDPGALAIRYLICLVTLIINIYGLGVGISTIKKFTSGRGWGMEIPTPKPYIFMIRVTRQIKCLIAQAPGRGVIPHPVKS